MPYPEAMVEPMREELTRLGVEELRGAEAVDEAFAEMQEGTMLLVINSVCGCAAANARPAVRLAKEASVQPDRYVTVFAGQDLEATAQAREKLAGIPPSSPFMALLKEGSPVFVVERRHIEGRSAEAIASDLTEAFEKHCGAGDRTSEEAAPAAENGQPERPEAAEKSTPDGVPDTFRSIT